MDLFLPERAVGLDLPCVQKESYLIVTVVQSRLLILRVGRTSNIPTHPLVVGLYPEQVSISIFC